jgi:hypothetical protein
MSSLIEYKGGSTFVLNKRRHYARLKNRSWGLYTTLTLKRVGLLSELNDAWSRNLTEDFIEVWSGCRIKSSTVAEFGGKGER